jgi:hypothetical protein
MKFLFPKHIYKSSIPPVLKNINSVRFCRVMKTVLILALIIAVCMCSEINPSKENPEGNEEKLVSNLQEPGNGQGGLSGDVQDEKEGEKQNVPHSFSDMTKGFVKVFDEYLEKSKEPNEFEEETKGVEKYNAANELLKDLSLFEVIVEVVTMDENPPNNSDLLDIRERFEASKKAAERVVGEIPEGDIEKLEKATETIDSIIDTIGMIIGSMKDVDIFSEELKELEKIRGGLKGMKDSLRRLCHRRQMQNVKSILSMKNSPA